MPGFPDPGVQESRGNATLRTAAASPYDRGANLQQDSSRPHELHPLLTEQQQPGHSQGALPAVVQRPESPKETLTRVGGKYPAAAAKPWQQQAPPLPNVSLRKGEDPLQASAAPLLGSTPIADRGRQPDANVKQKR